MTKSKIIQDGTRPKAKRRSKKKPRSTQQFYQPLRQGGLRLLTMYGSSWLNFTECRKKKYFPVGDMRYKK